MSKKVLVAINGHSGAGKSRLENALSKRGVTCPREILYTSRSPRDGEIHGKDYYFLSRGAIAALPRSDFFVGPVGDMLQAVDLCQVEFDLKANPLVFIEIFQDLWPGLVDLISSRIGPELRTEAVFLTAVDPLYLKSMTDERARSFIETEVRRLLEWRKKDKPQDIVKRSKSAVKEILTAIGPEGGNLYKKVFYSSPEGPDGQDEWTSDEEPIGRAAEVLNEFLQFIERCPQCGSILQSSLVEKPEGAGYMLYEYDVTKCTNRECDYYVEEPTGSIHRIPDCSRDFS